MTVPHLAWGTVMPANGEGGRARGPAAVSQSALRPRLPGRAATQARTVSAYQ